MFDAKKVEREEPKPLDLNELEDANGGRGLPDAAGNLIGGTASFVKARMVKPIADSAADAVKKVTEKVVEIRKAEETFRRIMDK